MMKEKENVFETRLEACQDEMRWLFMELYDDGHAYDYFVRMLQKQYEKRNDDLRKWDEMKCRDASWYKSNRLVGMMLYVDLFAGDLPGVMEHLDYLKECGVNYLHIMPILKSPEGKNDGGYAVADFTQVDPKFGTMEDLAALAKACHEVGIVVCLDFVMNHTSDQHPWALEARKGNREYQDRYFFYDNWDIPWEFDRTVPQVFPTTAPGNFSWCEEAGKVVMTSFYPYQWDLNYANPTVFNDMTENLLNLCNQGMDVIRLDAVPYIWKQLGTNCRNLPQVHNLVRLMRLATEVVCPGTLLLGEVVMEPDKVVPYFGSVEKPECHMLYNVTTMATTWHTVATRDVRLMEHQLGTVFALPHQFTFLNYLRCHDDIGWGLDYDYLGQFGISQVPHKKYLNDYLTGQGWESASRGELYNNDPLLGDARLCGTTASLCGIEAAEYEGDQSKLEWAIRRDIMLHAFLLTQSGIPVLYSGDEIGQKNDYSYHDDPLKADDSRYIHRGAFPWDEAALRSDPLSRQGRIFQTIRRLLNLRAEHHVFDFDADTWVVDTGNDNVLGIGRYYRGEKLIALFNFGDAHAAAWLEEPYTDLLTGEEVQGTAWLESAGFRWLLHKYEE